MADATMCAHEPCNCLVREDIRSGKLCSEQCNVADDETELCCDCKLLAAHALVGRVDDEELRAAPRFGVMAIVVLPLLPEGPIGPFGGIRPRELWLLVLFFTGLSFAGYLARRMFGAAQGYPLTGLIGGLISSTNVTFTFARLSRHERALSRPLAIGTIAACTMVYPRVLVAASVLNLAVARLLLLYLAAPFAAGTLVLAVWWRKSPDPAADPTGRAVSDRPEGLHYIRCCSCSALILVPIRSRPVRSRSR